MLLPAAFSPLFSFLSVRQQQRVRSAGFRGNGTAGDPCSFSKDEGEGGMQDGAEGESVDKSAEMEREEGRQAACLTPTGTLRVGGG